MAKKKTSKPAKTKPKAKPKAKFKFGKLKKVELESLERSPLAVHGYGFSTTAIHVGGHPGTGFLICTC